MNMLAKNRNHDLMRFHHTSQPFEELVKSVFNCFPGFRSELLFGSAIDSKLEMELKDDEVKLHLPSPGCKAADFEIEAVGDFVTIKVCKRDEKSEHGHSEEKCNRI
jgi:HSP20 family molecular chaperone IbpA